MGQAPIWNVLNELGEEVACRPRVLATEHSRPAGSFASSPSLAFSSASVIGTGRVRICRRIENALGRRKTMVLALALTTSGTRFGHRNGLLLDPLFSRLPSVRTSTHLLSAVLRTPQSWL